MNTAKLASLTLATGLGLLAQGADVRRPNVIFLLTDDLGFGDVGFTPRGGRTNAVPRIATPNLDRLASEGVVLTDHYCAAPVSAPSRASILTGRRQGRCSVRDNEFDAPIRERQTLGRVFHDAGYATAAIGKWGVGGAGGTQTLPMTAHPLDCGFDHFYGFPFHRAGHTYYHYDRTVDGVWMGVLADRTNATESAAHVYSTDLYTARAKQFVAECAAKREPFFLYLAINTVHGSGMLDDDIACRATLHVPGGAYPEQGVSWPVPKEDPSVANTWIDPRYRSLNPHAARYATAISRLDAAVGDLTRQLKTLGIDANTVLVVSSDNGPAGEYGADTRFFRSAGPFDGMKRDVFEGGMRVPTFIRWPGMLQPGVDGEPSASYDWLATFADLVGTPDAAHGTDGVSLLPRWNGRPHAASLIYSQYDGPSFGGGDFAAIKARKGAIRGQQQMLREGNYVALRTQMHGTETAIRLYDVVADPFQEHDLATDPAQAERVAAMKARLDALYVPRTAGEPFGQSPAGQPVRRYTLKGRGGLELDFTDWGGRVTGVRLPGTKAEVTIGFSSPQGWAEFAPYAGALIGRYANRIAHGRFTLAGVTYNLACNNKPGGIPCNLHGGTRGWNDFIWKVATFDDGKNVGAVLTRVSADGEEGFPGRMRLEVVYTLTPDNVWRIDYAADTDQLTHFSPTQHVFFNLDGGGNVTGQQLQIAATHYSELDAGLIPTGKALPVAGTPFDFRTFRPVGTGPAGNGYNDNWIIDGAGFRRVAALRGRFGTVEVWSDQPGLEVYSGDKFKDGVALQNGGRLERFGYLALETQHYPDSPNHPEFPSTLLRPGELYRSRTEYRFKP